jgi:hypothetical protein
MNHGILRRHQYPSIYPCIILHLPIAFNPFLSHVHLTALNAFTMFTDATLLLFGHSQWDFHEGAGRVVPNLSLLRWWAMGACGPSSASPSRVPAQIQWRPKLRTVEVMVVAPPCMDGLIWHHIPTSKVYAEDLRCRLGVQWCWGSMIWPGSTSPCRSWCRCSKVRRGGSVQTSFEDGLFAHVVCRKRDDQCGKIDVFNVRIWVVSVYPKWKGQQNGWRMISYLLAQITSKDLGWHCSSSEAAQQEQMARSRRHSQNG